MINEARRFGFAYGTLPDHVECGEERFTVECGQDDSVWYDILAFSRPRHPLAKLGQPLVRRWQKQFAQEPWQPCCAQPADTSTTGPQYAGLTGG